MPKDLSHVVRELALRVHGIETGCRLDRFLIDRVPWRSRTDLQSRIRLGKVLRNGRRSKPSARLRFGDAIVVFVNADDVPDQDPARIEIKVLHEDDAIIVVDKQPGLVVHPTGRHVYDTLMNALHLRYRKNGEAEAGVEPHVVHRLDKNTSGVMVIAKTFPAKVALQREFETRQAKKEYLALVSGVLEAATLDIDLPMRRTRDDPIRIKMDVADDGQASRTSVEVVERFSTATLVRALPLTGRQHQIRVHLAAIGHPILGDPLYGDPRALGTSGVPLLERHALHAERLSFRHPIDGRPMSCVAPLHDDMQRTLEHLRAGGELEPQDDAQSRTWRLA